jgi:transposase
MLKINKKTVGDKTYYTAQIVKTVRVKGTNRHENVLYLGPITKEMIPRLKMAFDNKKNYIDADNIVFEFACEYGNFYLIYAIMLKYGIIALLKRYFSNPIPFVIMIIQRCIEPGSRLAIDEWLDKTPIPMLLDCEYNNPSLKEYYRALDKIGKDYSKLEDGIIEVIKNNFSQKLDYMFYDITSSYLEGSQCIIACYGYSRDKRKDCKQIVISLLTTKDGFPVSCKIMKGNTADKSTIEELINYWKEKYPDIEIVLVGDRGMYSRKNIKQILKNQEHFVMALSNKSAKYMVEEEFNKRKTEELYFEEYPEELSQIGKVRNIICCNPLKRKDEIKIRSRLMTRFEEDLKKLKEQIRKKTLNDMNKVQMKIGALKKKHSISRMYNIEVKGKTKASELIYYVNNDKLFDIQKMDGVFVIQTDVQDKSAKDLITAYKGLQEVERDFRYMKQPLELRPIYVRKEYHVKGHVYINVLSLLIMKILEYKLKHSKLNISPTKALESCSNQKLVRLIGTTKKNVLNKQSESEQLIYKALEVKERKIN